jgi:hypothetical protein
VPENQSKDIFATTHWSSVQLAGRDDATRAQQALSKLCEAYWYALYAYIRRRRHHPEDAQDLTQEFFARLVATDSLAEISPKRGKFRACSARSPLSGDLLREFLLNLIRF